MSPVVVGVDGGGTTTDAWVAALDGTTLGTGRAGGSNWEMVGHDAMIEQVGLALDAALAAAERARADVVASAFGLAGVDWANDLRPARAVLNWLGLAGPLVVVNDAHIALRAGCSRDWGIVSNVGTGTVTAGLDRRGEWFRTMAVGWGEPSGASSLVRDAVHAVAAEHHRVGPPTSLTPRLLEALALPDVLAMFEAISRQRLGVGAHLAPLIDAAAAEGDDVALGLLHRSARRHGEMVIGVADRLGLRADDVEVVLAGGMHRSGERFFGPVFAETVLAGCPAARLVPLHGSPARGAVLLALEAL